MENIATSIPKKLYGRAAVEKLTNILAKFRLNFFPTPCKSRSHFKACTTLTSLETRVH